MLRQRLHSRIQRTSSQMLNAVIFAVAKCDLRNMNQQRRAIVLAASHTWILLICRSDRACYASTARFKPARRRCGNPLTPSTGDWASETILLSLTHGLYTYNNERNGALSFSFECVYLNMWNILLQELNWVLNYVSFKYIICLTRVHSCS